MAKIKVDYTLNGKRSSVSVDRTMFIVFSIKMGSVEEAREDIRNAIANGYCMSSPNKTMAQSVQDMIFRDCCKPSLIDKLDNDEGQFDIEDFI
jgi:hypothetical protein